MRYKKFSANQLFDGHRMLEDGYALILSEEGVVEDIVPVKEAGDEIEHHHGIISPGFINCHGHLELSHLKDIIPQNTGLADFVLRVIKDRHFSEETILDAIARAENEMIEAGIVAVGDICNNLLTMPQKSKKRIHYHNFIEASGFPPQVAAERFQRAVDLFNNYSTLYPHPAGHNSIVPHAPYSVSDELWQKIIHFPGNHLMTIHNQETEDENILFERGEGEFLNLYKKLGIDISFFRATGKSSFQSYLPLFLPGQPLIAVHNVYTSEDDIGFAKRTGKTVYWCFCPNANLYITGKLPAIDKFVTEDADIVLGTDSLASNGQLSILAEMQTIRKYFPSVTTENLFKWATINGAKALQMESLLGSFEPGKRPGVILAEPGLNAVRRLM
jgi:cytosine/adenosine deaminase-related metal-dependent hydrolase